MEPVLDIDDLDGIRILTLNRPNAMNALTSALRAALTTAIREADAAPDVFVIVLTGAGNRAFSAGVDLKEGGGDRSEAVDTVGAIEACGKPVIAAVNGVAITGGWELALACDIILAADSARFADTHVRVGLLPEWGLSQKLARQVGVYRAKEIALTGSFMTAEEANALGLVNRVVAAADLRAAAIVLARSIAEAPAPLVQAHLALIDDGYGGTLADGRAMERRQGRTYNEAISTEAIAAGRVAVMAANRESNAKG